MTFARSSMPYATEPEHLDRSAVEAHPIHSDCTLLQHPLFRAGVIFVGMLVLVAIALQG